MHHVVLFIRASCLLVHPCNVYLDAEASTSWHHRRRQLDTQHQERHPSPRQRELPHDQHHSRVDPDVGTSKIRIAMDANLILLTNNIAKASQVIIDMRIDIIVCVRTSIASSWIST